MVQQPYHKLSVHADQQVLQPYHKLAIHADQQGLQPYHKLAIHADQQVLQPYHKLSIHADQQVLHGDCWVLELLEGGLKANPHVVRVGSDWSVVLVTQGGQVGPRQGLDQVLMLHPLVPLAYCLQGCRVVWPILEHG